MYFLGEKAVQVMLSTPYLLVSRNSWLALPCSIPVHDLLWCHLAVLYASSRESDSSDQLRSSHWYNFPPFLTRPIFSITESYSSFARNLFISAPALIPSRWRHCDPWPCLTFWGMAGHTSSWTRHLYVVSVFVPRNSPTSSTFPWILISFMCCSFVFLGPLTLL